SPGHCFRAQPSGLSHGQRCGSSRKPGLEPTAEAPGPRARLGGTLAPEALRPPMETNRFLQLRKIFDEAALIPASQWETFLPQACGGDESLCAEARALLLAHQNASTTAVMA